MQLNSRLHSAVAALALTLAISACSSSMDSDETAQQVGDTMASMDEAGGSSGSYAMNAELRGAERFYARVAPDEVRDSWLLNLLEPAARAAVCDASNFSSCTGSVITRTFGGCTIGLATLTGTVTLTWAGAGAATCQATTAGDTITRVPDFTVTGRRGATLTVALADGASIGQRVTRGATAGSFTFTNDGIRRVFTTASGKTTLDFTTSVTSDITVTGASRSGRVVDGGTLHVVDNLNNESCDFSPSAVTWDTSTCNCPKSGSWSGSCSNGNTVTLTITGCGTATLDRNGTMSSVTFDRCQS